MTVYRPLHRRRGGVAGYDVAMFSIGVLLSSFSLHDFFFFIQACNDCPRYISMKYEPHKSIRT